MRPPSVVLSCGGLLFGSSSPLKGKRGEGIRQVRQFGGPTSLRLAGGSLKTLTENQPRAPHSTGGYLAGARRAVEPRLLRAAGSTNCLSRRSRRRQARLARRVF